MLVNATSTMLFFVEALFFLSKKFVLFFSDCTRLHNNLQYYKKFLIRFHIEINHVKSVSSFFESSYVSNLQFRCHQTVDFVFYSYQYINEYEIWWKKLKSTEDKTLNDRNFTNKIQCCIKRRHMYMLNVWCNIQSDRYGY